MAPSSDQTVSFSPLAPSPLAPTTPAPTEPGMKMEPFSPTCWRTVRPMGAYQLHGLIWLTGEQLRRFGQLQLLALQQPEPYLLALDAIRGHLLLVGVSSDASEILNPHHTVHFLDGRGLALEADRLWYCRGQDVFYCRLPDLHPQLFANLPYDVSGVAVGEGQVYVACQKSGYIHVFEQDSRALIQKLPAPGIGEENLTLHGDELWVCDRLEQSVYCLERSTGQLKFSALTPFESPTAVSFAPAGLVSSTPNTGAAGTNVCIERPYLWVAYAGDEPYIRENPNNLDYPLEVAVRDRTSIHPLWTRVDASEHYTLSNGYLIEMSYLEELAPLDEIHLENLEWQIALPAETHRQRVRQVTALGLPFQERRVADQRVACFHFPTLNASESRLFGWKALLEVRGIKYQLTPETVEDCPPLDAAYQQQYLVDDDELTMETDIVQEAARRAVGTETNILRKILKIRNYVYDRLSYALSPRIDTPDVVLERGVGSCGEYVGVLLALARLNGIACRTVGRYKCPPHPDRLGIPLQPDYNHVWLEFYIPGFGWVPMESNPDDVVERGPYPTRFFMGLPWYHVELGKGIRFETTNYRDQGIRLGDLALNHVRFTILGELTAQTPAG